MLRVHYVLLNYFQMIRECVGLQALLFAPHIGVATYRHFQVTLRRCFLIEHILCRTTGGCIEFNRCSLSLKFILLLLIFLV